MRSVPPTRSGAWPRCDGKRSPRSAAAPSLARCRAPPQPRGRATARRTGPAWRPWRTGRAGGGRGRPPSRRSRPRPTESRSVLAGRQPVFDPLEGLLADPPDVDDVLDLLEGTVLLPVLDDSLGVGLADARKRHQLVDTRRVDVHLLAGRRRRRRRAAGGGGRKGERRDGEYQDCSEEPYTPSCHGTSLGEGKILGEGGSSDPPPASWKGMRLSVGEPIGCRGPSPNSPKLMIPLHARRWRTRQLHCTPRATAPGPRPEGWTPL